MGIVINKIKQKVSGGAQSDIDVLKQRFSQMQGGNAPTQQQAVQNPVQQSPSATTPQATAIQQQAPQMSQPVAAMHQASSIPSAQNQNTSNTAPQQVAQPTQESQVQELQDSATTAMAMQASSPTVQEVSNDAPLPNAAEQVAATQAKSPMDALNAIPNQQQPSQVNVVEVEGQKGDIVHDSVITPGAPVEEAQANEESVVEESLENLRDQYDDAKLNSIIIDQVKELIEIDNNLNSKIEDLKSDLKKEAEERENLAKLVESRYKELKELEESIQKFIALYEVVTNQFNPFVKQSNDGGARMQELLHGKATKQVQSSQKFVAKSGSSIGSLAEMVQAIEEMNDNEFKHHVTPVKNDFAIWIHEAIGDEKLAQEVGAQHSKEALLKVLKSHL